MTTDDAARARLCDCIMALAQGATVEDANGVLDMILAGWGFRDCAQLAGRLPALTVPGQVGQGGVLFWLHATVLVNRTAVGRKLILAAAQTVARLDAADDAAPRH
jgi:hypothetical protein